MSVKSNEFQEYLISDKTAEFETLAKSNLEASYIDFDTIHSSLNMTDELVNKFREEIITHHKSLLESLLTEHPDKSEDIKEIITNQDTLSLEHVEDQLDSIQSGREIALLSDELVGPFDDFFPKYVAKTEAENWPNKFY